VEIIVNSTDLARLAVDMGKIPVRTVTAAASVIRSTAAEVEAGMRKDFSGHRHARQIPRAVNSTVRGLSAEVGVDKRGPQGPLGNILAFGTSKNAPVVNHRAALDRAMPGFVAALGAAADQAAR
jgi:hypothetical protein